MASINDYITAFDKLAKRFSEMEGWEVRQEKGNAYLHVSKPNGCKHEWYTFRDLRYG